MAVLLSLLAVAALTLTAWLDCRARRRVQAIKARDVTPAAIRYVNTPREDQP
ncbi:hypothetical protein [Kitasatospora griseola]|uniref:hypothetical protein n=1 Tax=Kitasatospora griseola TaxID=2064 RepID=UPI000B277760|nr:hypothetical protein [Kitasatospora griseola]